MTTARVDGLSARHQETRARCVAAIVIGVHVVIAGLFAAYVAFPNTFDELAHASAVQAQIGDPTAFPDLSRYRLLDAGDPTRWGAASNYINHPSLYYLAMAAFASLADGIMPARWLNIALSTLALGIVVCAGWRHLPTPFGRAAFTVVAAAFPKAPVIAGSVNNDNLAACAGALVFAGVVGAGGAPLWLAAGLALAGWTKLTALLSLITVAGCRQLWRAWRGEIQWLSRDTLLVAAGAAVGAVPYLVNMAQIGRPLYINEAFVWLPVDARPAFDLSGFAQYFLTELALKWPAAEHSLPLVIAAALALAVPLLAIGASVAERAAARIGIAYLIGLAVTLTIHFAFGWSAFQRLGDLTTPQTRYYGVLWPGLAFATAMVIARIGDIRRTLALAVIASLLVPTAIGGAFVALL